MTWANWLRHALACGLGLVAGILISNRLHQDAFATLSAAHAEEPKVFRRSDYEIDEDHECVPGGDPGNDGGGDQGRVNGVRAHAIRKFPHPAGHVHFGRLPKTDEMEPGAPVAPMEASSSSCATSTHQELPPIPQRTLVFVKTYRRPSVNALSMESPSHRREHNELLRLISARQAQLSRDAQLDSPQEVCASLAMVVTCRILPNCVCTPNLNSFRSVYRVMFLNGLIREWIPRDQILLLGQGPALPADPWPQMPRSLQRFLQIGQLFVQNRGPNSTHVLPWTLFGI